MKLSIKEKITFGTTAVVILVSLLFTILTIHFINTGMIREVQFRADTILEVAIELYERSLQELSLITRLTAEKNSIREQISKNDTYPLSKQLESIRVKEGLDFLTITDANGITLIRSRNPGIKGDDQSRDALISRVLQERNPVAGTELLPAATLALESPELVDQARIEIVSSSNKKKSKPQFETSGMVLKAAAPVYDEFGRLIGVLYAGKLLNNNFELVDKIANLLFKKETYKGKDIGTVSIILRDLRIATETKSTKGERAVGTHVSDEVRKRVLEEKQPWMSRTIIMNDLYLSAYKPITTLDNEVIGMIGLGILEQKYADIKQRTLFRVLYFTLANILIALFIAYGLSDAITRPLKQMTESAKKIATGDFDARVPTGTLDEFNEVNNAFNAMVEAIRERDEKLKLQAQEEVQKAERLAMIGRLASGIAHEINNPLGSILLFSRLLLQKAPEKGIIRENLERIEKDTKRCQTIVRGLLDFARQRDPKVEPVSLNELIDKTMRLFEGHPAFHNIEVVKELQAELPLIMADSAQIMQVFVNIIMNAIDAMENSGVLTIGTRTATKEDFVSISFTDTGCGIPPESLKQIFEPFFTTKAVGKGTGLGLAISYGIIQQHKGAINVYSRVGEGTTFVINLPKAKAAV